MDNVEEKNIVYSKVDSNTLNITTSFEDKVVQLSRVRIESTIQQLQRELADLEAKLAILNEKI